MENVIKLTGKIVFDPPDKTTKHKNQATWKRVAMVVFDNDDLCQYYAWFIFRRFNIVLNPPIRSAHVTFINDRTTDINRNWSEVKEKWNGKEIEIILDVDPRTNSEHWWMNVPNEHRTELQEIRNELGLSRPYFGMHCSIGYVNPKFKEHSEYIHELIQKGFIK
jgi:hypothetical protein